MSDQDTNKSPLSRRLQQQEASKRTAQNMQRVAEAQAKNAARVSGSIPTPKAELKRETKTENNFEDSSSPDVATQGKRTARYIIETTSGLHQAKELIAAGFKDEARQSIKRFLYRYSTNADAWWLYAQVPENEDQLYYILTALVNLPPNTYTAQARAKLAQLPYRPSSKGNPLATQTGEWVGKQVTQQISAYVGELTRQSQTQLRTPSRNKPPIALIAGIAIITVLLGMVIGLRQGATITPNATLPIPTVSAGDLFSYLLKVKLPISNLRSLPVPNNEWKGQQGIQFDVQQGGEKGTFIVVSYDRPEIVSADVVRTKLNPRYKSWEVSQMTNLLILIAPDTSPIVLNTISSHLSRYIIAPYRDYIPTATVTPGK
jgi:hypothetical protein